MNLKTRYCTLVLLVVVFLVTWNYKRSMDGSLYLGFTIKDDSSYLQSKRNIYKPGDSPITKCEVIHVALVVAGYDTSKTVVPLLKSILFYRHNPLHFHFITDSSAHLVLEQLMTTWQLPAVNYSFYATESIKDRVSWIPNIHYSGVYGLMKLILPATLPLSVEKVIVLDTDLTVVTDIGLLWGYFSMMQQGKRRRKFLGLVENQSNWYLGTIWKNHQPWPALERGFNTGVMLMDLTEMRAHNWEEMWKKVAQRVLQFQNHTSLADQDIINAVIKTLPDIHYHLPCSWNVQLSEHTLSEQCYGDIEGYNIIHWNSPQKLYVKNKHAAYFRNMYYTFLQYNGNLLQRGLLQCGKGRLDDVVSNAYTSDHSSCTEFSEEANMIHRVHIFYFGNQYVSSDSYDVTLVTQLSWDRIQILSSLLKHWLGPISICVYTTDYEAWQLSQFIQSSSLLYHRNNVAIHLVFKQGQFYPINVLRNIALKLATTPYVFLSDIDFLPMFDLYAYLKRSVKVLHLNTTKRALVVPAFETLQYKISFPKNKATLLKQYESGDVQVFRHSIWKKGHAATNYKKWTSSIYPYKVKWASDFEPYIVVAKNVTQFDKRFIGFGWNKVAHAMELAAQGYEFVVLPEAFTIHMPHAPSLEIARYRTNRKYRQCLRFLKNKFIQDLKLKYGSSNLTTNFYV